MLHLAQAVFQLLQLPQLQVLLLPLVSTYHILIEQILIMEQLLPLLVLLLHQLHQLLFSQVVLLPQRLPLLSSPAVLLLQRLQRLQVR